MKKVSCIGLGRVGQSLMRLFAEHPQFEVRELVARDHAQGLRAQKFIGEGCVIKDAQLLSECDIIFITTQDNAIGEAARFIPETLRTNKRTIIAHCSGSLTSGILEDEGIVRYASIHPLRSFADPEQAAALFPGTLCSIEGEEKTCYELKSAFELIGARVFSIQRDKKLLYHIASVFSSNFLHALVSISEKLYQESGIQKDLAQGIIQSLMRATLENISHSGNKEALTGPVARNELAIIQAHMCALAPLDLPTEKIYALLTQELVRLRGSANKMA